MCILVLFFMWSYAHKMNGVRSDMDSDSANKSFPIKHIISVHKQESIKAVRKFRFTDKLTELSLKAILFQ